MEILDVGYGGGLLRLACTYNCERNAIVDFKGPKAWGSHLDVV